MTQHDESRPTEAEEAPAPDGTEGAAPAPAERPTDASVQHSGDGAAGAPAEPSNRAPVEDHTIDNDTGADGPVRDRVSSAAEADDAVGAEHSELADLAALQAQIDNLQLSLAAQKDTMLRLQADTENQRKRAQKEVSNARKFALEGVVDDLLPVKDSLEMGIQAAQAAAENATSEAGPDLQKIIEGSELTLKMLAQVFDKHNIAEIDPVGEKFNPEFHQAMSMQEVEGFGANTVASVLQKGYTLNERLVRPALVMVAK